MGFRIDIARRWPDGVIPYVFAEEVKDIPQGILPRAIVPKDALADLEFGLDDKTVRAVVRECMARWESFVNEPKTRYIQFKPREGEKNYLVIIGDRTSTSGSIGLSDLKSDASGLLIGYVDSINAIPHELGHVLGLYHENERNVVPIDGKGGAKYNEADGPLLCPLKGSIAADRAPTIGTAIKDKKRVTVGKYDLLSIMHYPEMVAAKNDKQGVNQWGFNCSMKDVATYLSQASKEEWTEKNVNDYFNLNLLQKKVMNYPSADAVIGGRWLASPGDIAALRELYAK